MKYTVTSIIAVVAALSSVQAIPQAATSTPSAAAAALPTPNLSQSCQDSINQLANNAAISNCLPIDAIAQIAVQALGTVSTDPSAALALVPQALDVFCAAPVCDAATVAMANNSLAQGCASDVSSGSAYAIAASSLANYYQPIRESLCYQNSTNGYCIVETVGNVLAEYQSGGVKPNGIDASLQSDGLFGDVVSYIGTLPTAEACSDCNHAIYSAIINYQKVRGDSIYSNLTNGHGSQLEQAITTKCGASFTDGSIPASIHSAGNGTSSTGASSSTNGTSSSNGTSSASASSATSSPSTSSATAVRFGAVEMIAAFLGVATFMATFM